LQDKLSINFKVNKATYESAGFVGTPSVSFDGYTLEEPTLKNGVYVFTYKDLNPSEMFDDVTAYLIGTNSSGEQATGSYTTSVATYAENIFSLVNDDMKALLANMLNYGVAAQSYIGTSDENLGVIPDDMQSYITTDVRSYTENLTDEEGNFSSVSIALEDSISTVFKPSDTLNDAIDDTSKITATATVEKNNGSKVNLDVNISEADGKITSFTVIGINPSQASGKITLTVKNGDEEIATITTTVENYAASLTSFAEDNDNELYSSALPLVNAMMNYCDSAAKLYN
jgi:hypothetical protein